MEERLENRICERLENRICERLENRICERLENRICERLENRICERLENRISERLENRISERLENRICERLENRICERLENRICERLENRISERSENRISERLENRISQRWENRISETVGFSLKNKASAPTKSGVPSKEQTMLEGQKTKNHGFTQSKTLGNKYMLGDEIGKGAYGWVFKGLDLENGDFVAIKQVSLENIAQEDLNIIMQKIDLLKNLNHKNIVRYLGSFKTKSYLHIILEYVENGSLANIIKPNKFGPFPESLVAVYIAQVLEGLVYLHEQGVIHQDIKGANILTTKEGLVKLADFGVATMLTEADVNIHSVVGTPYWMAPEVIEMSVVCAASDIWSVGCTVIELLTCVPPYYDLHPMQALFRIVQDERPPIPESLSPDITDFLHHCFQKDARQRPDAKTLLSHPWIQNRRRTIVDVDLDDQARVTDNNSNKCNRVSPGQPIINCDLYINLEGSSSLERENMPLPEPPKEPVFNCPICIGPLVEEVSTNCGHIFCKACIKAAISAQSKCPTCRKKDYCEIPYKGVSPIN
ncbi:unnamed protein product [Lupinus luteus]|uniref:non-specific serine/threonine protein kinase n=1 Tax=Lupinus luteus TaxID=3873 RepID=A0AAV1YMB8_LUPLU